MRNVLYITKQEIEDQLRANYNIANFDLTGSDDMIEGVYGIVCVVVEKTLSYSLPGGVLAATHSFIKAICKEEVKSLEKILDKMKETGTGRLKIIEECTFKGYGTGSPNSISGYATYSIDSVDYEYVK